MDLIHGSMLPEMQSSYQQHNVQPIGHPWQRQGIRLDAPVCPLVSRTLPVWATVACMDELNHPF